MMDPEGFILADDLLQSADAVFDSEPGFDGVLSLSSGTSRSSSTLPLLPSPVDTSSSSSDRDNRLLASKPAPGPSTQFTNVRRLAVGYEPYPQDIPGRFPDMRLSQRTRRGHRKSRQGCYNCKKRKIKCQETLPACDNCAKKDLECSYPFVKPPSILKDCMRQSPSPLVPVNLQTTPIFSMADMHLFHHFMCSAYPHLPLGNDSVWVQRVPAIAHHYEFLMHAMLGIAASHLTVTTRADYGSLALSHRVKAIQGFNEALSQPSRSGSDGDALIAAVYALTFQSSYMSDGLREFLTMMRGCALVSMKLIEENVPFSFKISLEEHHEFMKSRLHDLPLIAEEFVQGAQDSLIALSSLYTLEDTNHTAYTALVDCMEAVKSGGPPAYYRFIAIHSTLYSMGHESFQEFIDPENDLGLLLLAHFVAIELIMSPIYSREWKGRAMSVPMNGVVDWITRIHDEISPRMRHYLAWPNSIATLVRHELNEKTLAPWLKDVIAKK